MIGTIDIKLNSANPNLPLKTLFSYVDSPSSLRIIDVPKKIGQWSITEVIINATYPDNSIVSSSCVLVGGCWVGTILGSSSVGKSYSGYTITANGIDENGNGVTGYILGKGDVVILDNDGRTIIDGKVYYLHLIDGEIPDDPKEGDVILLDDGWKIYHSDEWITFGGKIPQWGNITGNIESLTDLIEKFDIVDEKIDDVIDDVTSLSGDVYDVKSNVVDVKNDISAIQSKIPSQASSSNQLADKEFVNHSITTNTAYFRGTYDSIEELPTEGITNNDYAFVNDTDSEGNTIYKRYKYSNGNWAYEYTLENNGFTASQWSTINSGITERDKSYIETIPDEFLNIRQEVADDIQDVYVVMESIEDEFYRKTDQGTFVLSGLFEDGSTFSYNLLYLK